MYWNGFFVDLSGIFHLMDIDEKTVSEVMILLSITEICAFWIICLRWFFRLGEHIYHNGDFTHNLQFRMKLNTSAGLSSSNSKFQDL